MADLTIDAPAPAAAPVAAPVASPTPAPSPTPAVSAAPAASVAAPAPAAPVASPAPAPTDAPAAAPVAATPPAAPESYDFKQPENGKFDDKVLGSFAEIAKSLNLPQDGAQAILDKVGPVIQAQQLAALTEFYADIGGLPDTWDAATKADKEIGGTKLAENLAMAKQARDLGGPAFVKLLDKTGLGNHPEVIRTFIRIGKSLSEDKFVSASSTGTGSLSQADRLYGNTAKT